MAGSGCEPAVSAAGTAVPKSLTEINNLRGNLGQRVSKFTVIVRPHEFLAGAAVLPLAADQHDHFGLGGAQDRHHAAVFGGVEQRRRPVEQSATPYRMRSHQEYKTLRDLGVLPVFPGLTGQKSGNRIGLLWRGVKKSRSAGNPGPVGC